jgi:phage repressor protein C with HTH and peptisase S24 domain
MFLSGHEKALEKYTEGYKIPLLRQKVSCGGGVDWEDEQNINGYIDVFSIVPRYTLGRLFALSVQGNSMVGAGIKNGDYVLFCPKNDQYLDDDIYVFSLDGEVYCKQLEFDQNTKKIKIYSIRVADLEKAELLTTLNIEDADFADRFRIFGRVFSWIHPNFVDE